ncbi:MAG: PilZ domain-containing protein [Pseudomonadota bacterium]
MGKIGEAIKHLLEKRQEARHPYEVEVNYDIHQKAFQDYIRDISRGGTFIRTKNQIAVGHRVSLSIPLDHLECEVHFIGEIARKDHEGIGIKFLDIRPEDEAAIASFIAALDARAAQPLSP